MSPPNPALTKKFANGDRNNYGRVKGMLSLLNLLAFLAVAGYAVYLFVNLVYTRYLFIKLGKKAEFEPNLKERINLILINGFGQSKLFKDKKSGLMH